MMKGSRDDFPGPVGGPVSRMQQCSDRPQIELLPIIHQRVFAAQPNHRAAMRRLTSSKIVRRFDSISASVAESLDAATGKGAGAVRGRGALARFPILMPM